MSYIKISLFCKVGLFVKRSYICLFSFKALYKVMILLRNKINFNTHRNILIYNLNRMSMICIKPLTTLIIKNIIICLPNFNKFSFSLDLLLITPESISILTYGLTKYHSITEHLN